MTGDMSRRTASMRSEKPILNAPPVVEVEEAASRTTKESLPKGGAQFE